MTRLLGAVLAGGLSRRFGSDKALALFRGKTLFEHSVAALAGHIDAVIVCGRSVADHVCVEDRPSPHLGPLGGLNAALHHARHHGFDAVLSVGCDTPVLPEALLARLAEDPGQFLLELPIVGCWTVDLAEVLDRHLRTSEDRSIRGWARANGIRPIAESFGIPNVNATSDLAALDRSSVS